MNALALEVSRASRKPSSPGIRNCHACRPAAAISSPMRYCRRRSISCTPNTSTPNRTTAKIVTAGDAIASTAMIATSIERVGDDADDAEQDGLRPGSVAVVDVAVDLAHPPRAMGARTARARTVAPARRDESAEMRVVRPSSHQRNAMAAMLFTMNSTAMTPATMGISTDGSSVPSDVRRSTASGPLAGAG